MSAPNRAAIGVMLAGFVAYCATGVTGWLGVALSVGAAIIVLTPLTGGNRMDRSITPDVAGRCAFQAWLRGLTYSPRWDWADMNAREKAAWIAHATAPGFVTGTQPERLAS